MGKLSLHNGKLSNFKEIVRYGNAFVTYDKRILSVDAGVEIKNINVNFKKSLYLFN